MDNLPSQSEIARRMGVDRHQVSRWMGGARQPRYAQLRRLADALGAPVEQVAADLAVKRVRRHEKKSATGV